MQSSSLWIVRVNLHIRRLGERTLVSLTEGENRPVELFDNP
jgi:hypothetical protein